MHQNQHPRHVWRPLALKLRPGSPIFILPIANGDLPLALYKILEKSDRPIFCICRQCVVRRRKMAIFASLNPHISGTGQRPPTKFGALVEPTELHFHAKTRHDWANQFGAIDDEPMHGRRKMAILANLNPHILGGGQLPPNKFGTLVEPPGVHFCAKAQRDRSNHFRAIDDEVHGKCAKIGTPGDFGAL